MSLPQDDDEAVIPYSQTVRFPSRDEWADISKRITEAVIKTEGSGGTEEDPDILAINRKLDTMKIDLAFENTKLEDILALKSEAKCREAGKLRLEGKEYIVGDGDVINFRFNV